MNDIPENIVITIDGVDVRVVPGELDYAVANGAAIAENWQRQLADKPSLFNGGVYLAPQARLDDGVLRAEFIRTHYETLLYWTRDPSKTRPWHIFGIGVVVSADNRLIAGRMAARTAGGGRIYFPAGSIDDDDIAGGRANYARNAWREVMEETGLDLSRAEPEEKIHLVTANRSIALFRRYYFSEKAAVLVERIGQYLRAESDPELDAVIEISEPGQMGEATPSYVRAFADWHFNGAGGDRQWHGSMKSSTYSLARR
ncbi:NUDIX hydrolase [Brucella sp. IR073]|uniref:NUDIX hydrolase n=1 Tax=unclassified Brucella TaxID=2632610 RepID=UPI003B98567B